jgi:serine/threonine-protein kinase HipA
MPVEVYEHVDRLKVSCWGRTVGYLVPDVSGRAYIFSYDDDFQKSGLELSPLALPLDTVGPQTFQHLPYESFHGLPAFVADSLPDRFGNNLIDRWMADHAISKDTVTPLDRLAYMGKRAMGALEFQPATLTEDAKPFAIELQDLVEAARLSLNRESRGGSGLDELISVGTSAGGMRAKAVVGYDPNRKHFISGQFDVPEGYEHWLIKFDTSDVSDSHVSHDYGRIEYAYSLMAKQAEIYMMPCELYEINGRAHFMTKRFDRVNNDKLHLQSLFAMSELDYQPGVHSYNQLFMAIDALGLGYGAADEAFRRIVFNVAAFNNDDHVKNHSFIMSQDGTWSLAPAYDVTYAYNSQSAWTSQHSMSVNGKNKDITRADLLAVAQRFNVAHPNEYIDKILDVISCWPDFAHVAGVPSKRIDALQKVFKELAEQVG